MIACDTGIFSFIINNMKKNTTKKFLFIYRTKCWNIDHDFPNVLSFDSMLLNVTKCFCVFNILQMIKFNNWKMPIYDQVRCFRCTNIN